MIISLKMSDKCKYEQGVCHTVTLPFTLTSILRQRRIMEIQIFHHAKIQSSKKVH
jgi:hypothetical protein